MYTKQIPALQLPVSLRPRDFAIAELLDEHPLLTTEQLASIFFNRTSTYRGRLILLLRTKFLSRRWSDPFQHRPINLECWQPGINSSRYLACTRRKRPPAKDQLNERNVEVYLDRLSKPLMQTNAFFTRLLAHSRIHSDSRLLRWWSADTTASRYKMVGPNGGHGVWRDGYRETGFFVHLDLRSRYRPNRREQFEDFVGRRVSGNPSYLLLLVFQTVASERRFHQLHPRGSVPVGTVATATIADNPADAVWKSVGDDGRCLIGDLPSDHGPIGPTNAGAPVPEDDPLHALNNNSIAQP